MAQQSPQKPQQHQEPELPVKALKLMLPMLTQLPALDDKGGLDKTYFTTRAVNGDPGWDMTIDWRRRVVFFQRPKGKGPRGFVPFEAFVYAVTEF